MSGALLTGIDEHQVLETTLSMPYTLTTGKAAGTFLAELADRRLVGSRSRATGRVAVPPREYAEGAEPDEWDFVELAGPGTVTAWTRTHAGTIATIRLDGADTDLLHRIVGDTAGIANGARVRPVWSDADKEFLALAGFELAAGEPTGHGPVVLTQTAEPITQLNYGLDLNYRHAYGPYYGRMFDELASTGRILGSKCANGDVLVPARGNCDSTFTPTKEFVDVADTGVLQAFSVIHLEFVGQTRKPPYVYAEIVLDGSATRLIHTVGGIDVANAEETLTIGIKVRAVWKDAASRRGTLDDIDYFEPIPDGDEQ